MREVKVNADQSMTVGNYTVSKQGEIVLISKNGEQPGRFALEAFASAIQKVYENNF